MSIITWNEECMISKKELDELTNLQWYFNTRTVVVTRYSAIHIRSHHSHLISETASGKCSAEMIFLVQAVKQTNTRVRACKNPSVTIIILIFAITIIIIAIILTITLG